MYSVYYCLIYYQKYKITFKSYTYNFYEEFQEYLVDDFTKLSNLEFQNNLYKFGLLDLRLVQSKYPRKCWR